MVRLYLETLRDAVCIALSIGIVIAFAAVGCAMNKRDSYTSHNVKGFRASSVSRVLSDK
jgi:hypothetical protein